MPDDLFFGKAAAIWHMGEIRGGDPALIVKSLGNWGQGMLLFKYGNGLTKWQGLEEVCAAAKAAGYLLAGYWFNYGHPDEGRLMAEHAVHLELDVALLDWETAADNAYLGDQMLAKRIGGDFKARAPNIPLGLCSWWWPFYHQANALKDLLVYCDYNFPQVYQLKNYSNDACVDDLNIALEQYGRLWDGGPEKTVPGFAAYDIPGWSPSNIQLREGQEHAKALGCPGVWLWSWNALIGASGSNDGQRKTDRIDEIKSWDWPAPVEPEPTCEEKLADCITFAQRVAGENTQLKENIEMLQAEIVACGTRRGALEIFRASVLESRDRIEEAAAAIKAADPGPDGTV